jgi:V/A-type H+-transporting ATPase subunit I
MFTTTPMKYVVAMVLQQDIDAVSRAILDQGVVEFSSLQDQTARAGVHWHTKQEIKDRISNMRQRIQHILDLAHIALPNDDVLDTKKMQAFSVENYEAVLQNLTQEIDNFKSKQKPLEAKLQIKEAALLGVHVHHASATLLGNKYSGQLAVHMGRIAADQVTAFEADIAALGLWVHYEIDDVNALYKIVGLSSQTEALKAVQTRYHWREAPTGELNHVHVDQQTLRLEIYHLKEDLRDLHDAANSLITKQKTTLLDMWVNLRLHELYQTVQNAMIATEKTTIFAGWVPSKKVKYFINALEQAAQQRMIYEIYEAHQVKDMQGQTIEAPTEMTYHKIFSPFAMLIKMYAIPAYKTINPIHVVSFLFMAMFGLMFADMGQGAIIFIIGLILTWKQHQLKEKAKYDFPVLLTYCGLAAIGAGALFGNCFGYEIYKPLWFDYESIVTGEPSRFAVKSPIGSIYDVFHLAIGFGVVLIGLSYVFNWINRWNRREYITLIFHRNGLLGGIMYGVSIWAVWNFVQHTSYETYILPFLIGTFVICGLLMFLGEPLEHFMHHKDEPISWAAWLGNWFLEIYEFIISSLTNTLSFIRVAGLGVAHVALMHGFYSIAQPLPLAGKIAVMIAANVVVIILEGLSAGINALRLNYYEFFSRYFIGNGRIYQPIKLKKE